MAANLDADDEPRIAQSFLALAPPHWASRGLSYAIIAVVLIAGVAAVVIKLPETVTADFVLAPVRGTDPVKATRRGLVSQILVSEGQEVKQGEVIATLRSEAAGDRAAELMTVQTRLAGAGESFINAKARFTAAMLADEQERRKLAARVEHLEGLIALKRQQLALLSQMAESYEKLYRQGIASRAQWTERQLEVANLQAEVARLVAEQQETGAAMERLKIDAAARRAEFKEVERTYREATATGEIRAAALQDGLVGSDGNEIRLTAPCAGVIVRLHVKSRGALLHEGDIVAELAGADDQLQAELSIPEAGVGKLQAGLGVKLKYDAFPYQRYGVRYGRVAWLSPTTIEGTQGVSGVFFRAKVDLAESEVFLQGERRALLAGMRGKAEIVIGKRSLIEYVFEPLRQLQESVADVPEQAARR